MNLKIIDALFNKMTVVYGNEWTKKWEQRTGREFPEEGQSFWTPGADMELLK